MKCSKCNDGMEHGNQSACPRCGYDLSIKAEPPREETLHSGDLVADAEAALRHIKAMITAAMRDEREILVIDLNRIDTHLKSIVESERRRSATDLKLSDSGGLA